MPRFPSSLLKASKDRIMSTLSRHVQEPFWVVGNLVQVMVYITAGIWFEQLRGVLH